MAFTIFYSWQSDISNSVNRGFIEDALKKAIKKIGSDITIQEALRDDEIVLDKDTKGVSGTPPIADVIFNKISNCGIFLPDVTFVCTSEIGRKIPNPNVLIEYGWALREVTLARIIMVMNTAFGEPTSENMPFDMRHLRNPITYCLDEDTPPENRAEIKKRLVKSIVEAIKSVIESDEFKSNQKKTDPTTVIQSTTNPSTFLKPDESFPRLTRFGTPEDSIYLPDVGRFFLRLIPSKQVLNIRTQKEARDLIMKGGLAPMGDRVPGISIDRNKHGAFTFSQEEGLIRSMSQLFLNSELWGIDTYLLDKEIQASLSGESSGVFPSVALEDIFIKTLANYLMFAQKTLNLPVPLQLIAGATDVSGYRMAAKFGGFVSFDGYVLNEHIVYESEIKDYDQGITQILRPFFNHIWDECDLDRPDVDTLR